MNMHRSFFRSFPMWGLLMTSWSLYAAGAEEFPVAPYVDPRQLDCPWPKMSHYLQPWRGYLETRSGDDFLRGLGVNLQIPGGTEEPAIRLLAESGLRTFRIEVGWGEMNWDETQLNNEAQLRRRLALCTRYGIRPTILINAHQGVPCPMRGFQRRLVAAAPAGSTTVTLDSVADLVPGRSGLSQLTTYWAAEALVTAVDAATGVVTLSKPLPKALPAGPVPMATLKYAPLHPVGTPEFDTSAAGCVRHTLYVCGLVRAAGVKEFDIEIWNEMGFGTHFLNINDYYDKAAPKIPGRQADHLNRGGRCWELARRIVAAVKQDFPETRCIWGFSNTTFFHCQVTNLPPGTEGQSYHPYGTGMREIDGHPARPDQPSIEGFVPRYALRMPEGWAGTFVQTESLIRLLNPATRLAKMPAGVTNFHHYMTEHGVLPPECGANDDAGAWRLKTLCATRSFCFWLNKGVDALHYFCAYQDKATDFGLLPTDLKTLPADAKFDDVATPPMRALRNLTRAFAGSVPFEHTKPLAVEVTALGAQTKIFEGDATHPPLWARDVLAVLPFQVHDYKHVVAVYVMTRDAMQEFSPAPFRLKISGACGECVTGYDPLEDRAVPLEVRRVADGVVEVTLPVADHPRLLTLAP